MCTTHRHGCTATRNAYGRQSPGESDLITFQYFDGCPHAGTTLENLLGVLDELGIPESVVERIRVEDAAHAEACRFQGSPTILVDGVDLVTGEVPFGFHYACRMYSFEGGPSGSVPRDLIRARLAERGGLRPARSSSPVQQDREGQRR